MIWFNFIEKTSRIRVMEQAGMIKTQFIKVEYRALSFLIAKAKTKQNKTKKNHENRKSKDELTVQQLKGTSKSELVFIELTHRFHIQNIVIYTDIT